MCNVCQTILPEHSFYISGVSSQSLRSTCKECKALAVAHAENCLDDAKRSAQLHARRGRSVAGE
eukprot:3616908-Amphidinium_carterae.1